MSTPTDDTLLLRPGTLVARRDARSLQVGLDAPQRVLLTDCPAVRRLLDDLASGRVRRARPGRVAEAQAALARLVAADLVLPATVPPPAPGSTACAHPASVAATRAWAGSAAGGRLSGRARPRVALRGPTDLSEPLARLLGAGGLDLRTDDDPADLVVVLGDGEPRRADLDPLVRGGVPHLLLWARGGLPRVGPLVVPGLTACLRCVDAHDSESDPRRPLVLEQAAAQPGPAVRDPTLAALALAWAARDVQRYAEGEPPTSWSAVVTVTPAGLPDVATRRRHPHCGCAWDADLYAAG